MLRSASVESWGCDTYAVIAEANVAARYINTGETIETVSSGTGNYVIAGLRVGTYELSANSPPSFAVWSLPSSANCGSREESAISSRSRRHTMC